MILIAFACLPASLLIPVASYITMIANTNDIENSILFVPQINATAVHKLVTLEECELGIPPVSNSFDIAGFPPLMQGVKIFIL